MRRYLLAFTIFCLCLSSALAASDDWSVTKSTHFIIYYKKAPADFIDKAVQKSEYYYNKIADDLGFRRFNFWLWDNRARIYIHDDAASYRAATGQPEWSRGCAIVQKREIHTFSYAQEFFDATLPHEMGHIIFREFVGFYNPAIPIWLDEGVASYEEETVHSTAKGLAREAVAANRFINLENLSKTNPHSINDINTIRLFYAEAVSAVDYLVKEFGQDGFILFCQNLRDKQDMERAIAYVYPFRNIRELDAAWQKYLQK
ncbi:MAG: peptidase MA family metallohydrolase [Candidatus Omnitrophota bacterium]